MATTDIASLKESITQYETQLSQIRFAIDASSPGPDKENLVSLQSDIQQLIDLTKEHLGSLQKPSKDAPIAVSSSDDDDDDPFAKEYALFKAELASSDGETSTEVASSGQADTSQAPVDIQSDLNELQGMKCQAPHSHQWGGSESYHNALVYSVEPSEDVTDLSQIQVRVMFTNPTHQEMLPCPYFLEGECRFLDDQCRFSHGERVNLLDLKEYREPNFGGVRQGSRVLVKHADKLWHRAVVTALHGSENRCEVKFESSRGKTRADLHDILPMTDGDRDEASQSDSCTDDEPSEEEEEANAALVERSLVTAAPSTALGSWEEHTKGFGSRMMAQMGYITGTGLGRYGEGRIEPVEAVVLPAGKSLDHCMQLREEAGGDKNLFKVERRMRRLQRKQQASRDKQFENEKRNARTDVFDFINTTLGGKRDSGAAVSATSPSPKPTSKETLLPGGTTLKTETCRGLNVVSLQLSEEIRRTERDLAKLDESLSRHTTGSAVHKAMAAKRQDKQTELHQLRANERSIDQERSQRKDRRKLSVF